MESTLLANTAAVVGEIFKSPTSTTIIDPRESEQGAKTGVAASASEGGAMVDLEDHRIALKRETIGLLRPKGGIDWPSTTKIWPHSDTTGVSTGSTGSGGSISTRATEAERKGEPHERPPSAAAARPKEAGFEAKHKKAEKGVWVSASPGGKVTRKPSSSPLVVPAVFKLVFLTIVGITVSCGIAQIVMAAEWSRTTANQQSVFEAIGFAWKSGIGAIFGLLGGKVLK